MLQLGRFKDQVEERQAKTDEPHGIRSSLGLAPSFSAVEPDATSVARALYAYRGSSRPWYPLEANKGVAGEAAYVFLDAPRLVNGARFSMRNAIVLRDEIVSRDLGPAVRYELGSERLVARPFENRVYGDPLSPTAPAVVYIPGVAALFSEREYVGGSYSQRSSVRFDAAFMGDRDAILDALVPSSSVTHTVFANISGDSWFTMLVNHTGSEERLVVIDSDGQVIRNVDLGQEPFSSVNAARSLKLGFTYGSLTDENLIAFKVPCSGVYKEGNPVHVNVMGDFAELEGAVAVNSAAVGSYGRHSCFVSTGVRATGTIGSMHRGIKKPYSFWDQVANTPGQGYCARFISSERNPQPVEALKFDLGRAGVLIADMFIPTDGNSSSYSTAAFADVGIIEYDDGTLCEQLDDLQALSNLPAKGRNAFTNVLRLRKRHWTLPSGNPLVLTYHE